MTYSHDVDVQKVLNILKDSNIVGLESIYICVFFWSIIKLKRFSNIELVNNFIGSIDNIETTNDLALRFNNIIEKIHDKFSIFNFKLKDGDYLLKIVKMYKDFDNIDLLNCIDDLFTYAINTENLVIIKDYIKYYSNPVLIDWIVEHSQIKSSDIIFDGNTKINSFINRIVVSDKFNPKQHYGLEQNNIIRDLTIVFLMIKEESLSKNKHVTQFDKNIINTDVLHTDLTFPNNINTFDKIFFDFPNGIHNITHASCCKRIKNLKLRGTKSEPLLLQLVMMSLNKNGQAFVIVPDSLLYSDSVQPIETRKYLLENYNVKEIIQLDESVYFNSRITRDLKSYVNTCKNSLLIFENKGKTENVVFSKLTQVNDNISNDKILDVNINLINNNLYSLFYKQYQNDTIKIIDDTIVNKPFSEIFEVYSDPDQIKLSNKKIICLEKYNKNENSVKLVDNKNISKDYELYIICKDSELYINDFVTLYLINEIKSKPDKFIKGKLGQFDLDKINKYQIPIFDKNKQNTICNYLNLTNKMIESNNEKISLYQELNNCIVNSLSLNKTIIVSDVLDIFNYDEVKKESLDNVFGVIKNGLAAGTVYQVKSLEDLSNNSYYFTLKPDKIKQYNFKYIYNYIKENQNIIEETARLTSQPCVTKSTILAFKIPNISINKQNNLVLQCDENNMYINKYNSDNSELRQKDIISVIKCLMVEV